MKNKVLVLLAVTLGLHTAQAHRLWVLPSSTVLSGENAWVAFDACVSNNIFFANHRPLSLDSVVATAPDGNKLTIENPQAGNIRSTFDVKLEQQGTYRIGVERKGLMAFYKDGEERRRWQGTREELVSQGIVKKDDVRIVDSNSAVIAFVTLGNPSKKNLEPKNQGLEILFPDTHPNDLVTNEEIKVAFLLDGKPAAGLEITVIKHGDRHRNNPGEVTLTTDAKGETTLTFPEAAFYWLEAETTSKAEPVEGVEVNKRASLSLTLEVLPE